MIDQESMAHYESKWTTDLMMEYALLLQVHWLD